MSPIRYADPAGEETSSYSLRELLSTSTKAGDIMSAKPRVRRSRMRFEPFSGEEVREILVTSGDGVDPHLRHGAEGGCEDHPRSVMHAFCTQVFVFAARLSARSASRRMAVWLKYWRLRLFP